LLPTYRTGREIVFRFHDRSVKPKFHCSYTIRITPTSIRRTVDSYGTILSSHDKKLTRAQYDELMAAISKHGLKSVTDSGQLAGCTGGTGRSVKWTRSGVVQLEGRRNKCGGKEAGTLAGDLDRFEARVAAIAPTP